MKICELILKVGSNPWNQPTKWTLPILLKIWSNIQPELCTKPIDGYQKDLSEEDFVDVFIGTYHVYINLTPLALQSVLFHILISILNFLNKYSPDKYHAYYCNENKTKTNPKLNVKIALLA